MIPVLPMHEAIKSTPAEVEIYQSDLSAPGGRQPVLLVHGLKDEYAPGFHMRHIREFLTNNPAFQKRYKLFLARYDTAAPEKKAESDFKVAIKRFSAAEGRPLVIIAVSLSGTAIRNAMSDSSVDHCVNRMITLGTPFHGTPFFSHDWMVYSFWKNHLWPTRFSRYLAYKEYFKLHPNLLADHYWDNYDGQVPEIGSFKYRLPFLVEGTLLPPSLPPDGSSVVQDGRKITAYGGYLQTRYTKRPTGWERVPFFHAPVFFVHRTIPAFFGREHSMLRLINHEMADSVSKNSIRDINYAFSDGIGPVTSLLSVSESVPAAEYNLNNQADVEALKSRINVGKARLFANIDHVTFLDGRGPFGHRINLTDKFSPSETPRPIFAWLLSDLLDRSAVD